MTSSSTQADADRAFKARHRFMWSLGDYPGIADHLLSGLGPTLVEEALRAAPAARRLTAPLWGREEHVRELLGDRVTDVSAKRRILTVDHFGRPEDFRDYVKLLTATKRRERIPGPR